MASNKPKRVRAPDYTENTEHFHVPLQKDHIFVEIVVSYHHAQHPRQPQPATDIFTFRPYFELLKTSERSHYRYRYSEPRALLVNC